MASIVIPGTAAMAQSAAAPTRVDVIFRQMGVPVQAHFKKIDAKISYRPDQPSDSKAEFRIDMTSFDLGSPEYNKEVLKPEWFDATRYPQAIFYSTSIKVLSPTQWEATGKLTLKGKTQNIRVPITLKSMSDAHQFESTLRIQRLSYEIGAGKWQDTGLVADEVVIKVQSSLPRKK
jgi:polyisoprenoid-binding protein YceI